MAKPEKKLFNAPNFYSFGSINLWTVKYCAYDYLTCGLVHFSFSQTEHTYRKLGLFRANVPVSCDRSKELFSRSACAITKRLGLS